MESTMEWILFPLKELAEYNNIYSMLYAHLSKGEMFLTVLNVGLLISNRY